MATKYSDSIECSSLFSDNSSYIMGLYESYLQDKKSVSDYWQQYFADNYAQLQQEKSEKLTREKFYGLANNKSKSMPIAQHSAPDIQGLLKAYREYGYKMANCNPLYENDYKSRALDSQNFGFKDENEPVSSISGFTNVKTIADLTAKLRTSYCLSVGAEFSYVNSVAEYDWLCNEIEQDQPFSVKSPELQQNILAELTAAEGMEHYFSIKYVGQKRFSLEGTESLIPLLNRVIKYGSRSFGINEVVIGMAHRGRLNVMLNIMGMTSQEIFKEFEGTADYGDTSGDVKYHLGYSADMKIDDEVVHLSLMFNPSHLEFIGPVVTGSVRARQEQLKNSDDLNKVVPIIIHGDSALSGQGVVAETLNMSQTRGFSVSGSLHIVINNQLGFTTSNLLDIRSSVSCTDIAKSIGAPVLHVNGDDVEAVVRSAEIAIGYRNTFGKDIFIDLIGYRRLGHNEADEPSATQPLMYQKIRSHKTTRALYAAYLKNIGVVSAAAASQMLDDINIAMDQGLPLCNRENDSLTIKKRNLWNVFVNGSWKEIANTAVASKKLKALGQKINLVPESFELQKQVKSMMTQRRQMIESEQNLNWGMAEMLSYASLIEEGYDIRLVGQDSNRGTFAHRHATLFDQKTGKEYQPLANILGGKVAIYDSVLSETGPLAFEYGYSTTNSNCLVIWEAQFGDFSNAAQVIIDQFITSGCQKWRRLSSLVMFLPHGYEGMGPEHSSARLERFLQLSAQNNIQVCVPTTASQIFHLLRRQMIRRYRKPLIVMTPKSLLRHPSTASSLTDLSKGRFELILPDSDNIKKSKVKRVILCSGKVYYDLYAKRKEAGLENITIIRIEQLYPFPYDHLDVLLSQFKNASDFIWCQEEPKNQGAWYSHNHRISKCLPKSKTLTYAGRSSAAAPAAGYARLHKKQQEELVLDALGLIKN
jgi:2-oxoglutarate dehydrogenase E1 component